MFHRILETFFLIQVFAQSALERACQLKDEALESVNLSSIIEKKSARARAHKERNGSGGTHTLDELPAKFRSLFRQISRYVFVSVLGAILGKS
jgi:hypothetical protein